MAFYNQVNGSDHSFTHNKKVALIAAKVADELDYIKSSVSKMSQSDFKGKKYGQAYTLYFADPGTVHEGLEAHPDDITEVPTEVFLRNFNTSCTLDAWNELGDIESFKQEICDKRVEHLARQMGKSIIEDNIFKDFQAVVANAPSFGVLSDASAALNELAVGGEVVSFMNPTVMGKIAAGGLANFIPGTEAKELYGKNYLGQYAGAEQIQSPLLPTVTTPASYTGSITLVADSDGEGNVVGFEAVDEISGTNLKAGLVFTLGGDLKIVDQSGIETEQPVSVIVLSANQAGTKGKISPLRITVKGKGYGNPNAWVEAGTTSLTLTAALEASTTYWVGQVRTRDALAYDSYKFENLPGSDNEAVSTVGNVTAKMSVYGDGTNLSKLVRIDCPFGAGLYEPRSAVAVFIKKA